MNPVWIYYDQEKAAQEGVNDDIELTVAYVYAALPNTVILLFVFSKVRYDTSCGRV